MPMEQMETRQWVQIAASCGHFNEDQARDLTAKLSQAGKMLNSMMRQSKSFCGNDHCSLNTDH
jgi:four helix bundle protein